MLFTLFQNYEKIIGGIMLKEKTMERYFSLNVLKEILISVLFSSFIPYLMHSHISPLAYLLLTNVTTL